MQCRYVDTLSKGIKYNKNDVVIEFFKDAGCTDKIATWAENSGKFTVDYDDAANTMTIRMADTGLAEINEAATVYTDSVKRGYSDCTMRLTYAAALTADAKMGDTDNPNEVVLTWKRTNTTYFDTLKDCCHVYTYGIDVLKQFSDNGGNVRNVKFRLHNDTDDVFVIADLKDGVYYAKGFATKKTDATTFVPNSSGHVVVKGLEDDAYSLTEIATDKGYVLLRDAVKIAIKTAENGQCEKCGAKLLTASATVNGKDVTMTDGNAIVPLTVVNNPGFDLPKTGGYGTWMFTVGGVALLGAAAFMMAWSAEPKKGYLTREGIAVMRSRMTNAIFHEEMKELYIKKDAAYKESIQTAKESLLLYIRMLENSESADPVIEQKLCDLPHALEQVDGKHVYGYLPKEIKAQVDEIVEQLAQLPEVAACYEQWWKLKDEIASYYGRNTPSHQPLVQQKEFRAIKNMIIQQAETFRQPVSEQVPVETEPNEQQVPPSTESPAAMAQPQAVASQSAIEVGVVSQLLHHMSRVFRGNMPVIPPALRIDSKRRRRLQEKRMAMGHKRDDHEDEQLHHVNDNAMR